MVRFTRHVTFDEKGNKRGCNGPDFCPFCAEDSFLHPRDFKGVIFSNKTNKPTFKEKLNKWIRSLFSS